MPALTLPALMVLVGLPHFGLGPSRPAVPQDSIPPPWKPAPRLVLEDLFVQAALPPLRPPLFPVGLLYQQDPRVLHITVDPDSGTVSSVVQFGSASAGPPVQLTMRQYARQMTADAFRRKWRETTMQQINSHYVDPNARPTTGLQFALPVTYPKQVQGILGPGGPALNVSGSENIKISGESDWSNQQVTQLGTRRSLFPTLNMQQDLDIRLEGQLSDRVRVNLLQNSANQVPLANRIAINYRGEEDDLVQELDLGNTNLSLPGTQYVSYSGKNEGLFGIKTTERWGPLDFTLLASKQEGRSERANYSGGSSKQVQTLYDFDYIRGQYFFLYDPNAGPPQFIEFSTLQVYRDNNDYRGGLVNVVPGFAVVHPETYAQGDTAVRGSFNLLASGADKDYVVTYNLYGTTYPVLKLRQRMDGQQRLAVIYQAHVGSPDGPLASFGGQVAFDTDSAHTQRTVMKLVRAPLDVIRPDSLSYAADPLSANFDTTARAPFNATRELELKNLYQLQGQRIDQTTFKLTVRQGQNAQTPQNSTHDGIPYIEAVGLDNVDESGGVQVRGHDGKVDGTPITSGSFTGIRLVDFEQGIVFFPDLRPFAPRIGPSRPFEQAVNDQVINRRVALVGPPDPHTSTAVIADNASNPAIYDRYQILQPNNFTRSSLSTYFIDVEFTAAAASGEIALGRGQLLEGSETVTVDGQAWVRDRDYTIDYDLGRITLKRSLQPGQSLNVDYSYAPLFQQAGRTLVGNAFRWQSRGRQFGGAFLYESHGAQDLRPRIGEEPSRSLIGDLNTDLTFQPEWMTRLVDALPGVRTTTPSDLRVQAEVGASFPNPNTANQVYIDDMEGIRDAVSLSMGPERWRWTSIPQVTVNGIAVSDSTREHDAEIHWYSPVNVTEERDLKPGLSVTDPQGSKNAHQALAISIPRRPRLAPTGPMWAGLTYPLDAAGLDLSRSQFLEVWVNDFRNPLVRGQGGVQSVKLHIDLGTVSEDQQRAPDEPPNGALDTEDKVRDNQLTVTDQNNEDTGLDGRPDRPPSGGGPSEQDSTLRDLTTATDADREGDDFQRPSDPNGGDVSRDKAASMDPASWRFTNGTEGNKDVNPTPDTEDLDLNNSLDLSNNYVEYTIDLADSAQRYLLTDVYKSFASSYDFVADDNNADGPNGWRLYRIPLNDIHLERFGNPNLALTKHARIWLEGIEETDDVAHRRPLLMLGGLDIVGSRWQVAELDSAARAVDSTTVTINTVNSVDNADKYFPLPFDPGETRNGNQPVTRREQSLALEFTGLGDSARVEAYKTFSLDENYSRYGKLDWFVAAIDSDSTAIDPITYAVRFASDELGRNYYEYRGRVPNSQFGHIRWSEVKLDLTDLSNLKLAPDFPRADPIHYEVVKDGAVLVVHGRPSFTRLRRISFGVFNERTRRRTGQAWFDELRATDVAKDVGRAQRVQVTGSLANLLSYNMGWNGRGADFLSVGETRGSGNTDDQFTAGGTMQLNRFFEGTGIALPVTFSYAGSRSSPRFTAGDDVVRTGPLAQSSITRSDTRSWSTSYARTWSDRSNALLRYTLGGVTANYQQSTTSGFNPSTVDHAKSSALAVNYSIGPRKLLTLGMPLTKARLYLLPERAYWNYSITRTGARSEERFGALRDSLRTRTDVTGRAAFINMGADSRPFDLIHHHIEAVRNLTLPDSVVKVDPLGRLGPVNLGRVTNWRQTFDVSRLPLGKGFFQPVLTWNSQYNQNNGPELSPTLGVRQVSNGQTAALTWDMPFDRFGGTAPPAFGGAVPDSTHRRARGPGLWRVLAQHLGTVSTDLGFNTSSSYSRLSGTPSALYLLGLARSPDTSRVRREPGNDSNDALDWRAGLRTRITLVQQAMVSTQINWTARRTNNNSIITRSRTPTAPNVLMDIDYGQLPHVLRLDRVLLTPTLRTTWNHTGTLEFGTNQTSRSTGNEFRPLIGVTGTLRGGARVEFNYEHHDTRSEQTVATATQVGSSVTDDHVTTLNSSVNWSFQNGKKVTVMGKTSTVSSNVTVGITGNLEHETGGTRQTAIQDVLSPKDTYRLSLLGNSSYGFSSNVTGNFSIGYNQNGNRLQKSVNRGVRLEARAQFTF